MRGSLARCSLRTTGTCPAWWTSGLPAVGGGDSCGACASVRVLNHEITRMRTACAHAAAHISCQLQTVSLSITVSWRWPIGLQACKCWMREHLDWSCLSHVPCDHLNSVVSDLSVVTAVVHPSLLECAPSTHPCTEGRHYAALNMSQNVNMPPKRKLKRSGVLGARDVSSGRLSCRVSAPNI